MIRLMGKEDDFSSCGRNAMSGRLGGRAEDIVVIMAGYKGLDKRFGYGDRKTDTDAFP